MVFVFGGGLGAGIGGLFRIAGLFLRGLAEAQARRSSDDELGADIEAPTRTQVQWAADELLGAKLERLRSALEQAFEQISEVRRDAQSADAELRAALDQVSRDLRTASASLNSRIDEAEWQAATIDSRGVLLLGVGVILTVIPDGLALVGWVGWLDVGISGFLLLSVLLAVGREWHGHRSKAAAGVS